VLNEGKVGLEKIWEISEAIADLDAPIFALNDKISELRQDIETFQPHNKQAPLIENSKQPEVQHAK
jgi:hypothetical protein